MEGGNSTFLIDFFFVIIGCLLNLSRSQAQSSQTLDDAGKYNVSKQLEIFDQHTAKEQTRASSSSAAAPCLGIQF